jgi:iron(III) transport system ATP-binding protein
VVVAGTKNGVGEVKTGAGTIRCILSEDVAVGENVVVMVRPEDLTVCQETALPDHNVIECQVDTVIFTGEVLDCWVSVSDQQLRIKVHPSTLLEPGKKLKLYLPPEGCRVLPSS